MARRPRRPVETVVGTLLALALAVPAMARTTTAGTVATTVVSGLREPTALAILPDERLVVLEKRGHVRLWTPSAGLLPSPILTVPVCTASEMGLLGVVADPGFAANGFLYLYLTNPPGGVPARCAEGSAAGRRNRIVRVTMTGDAIDPGSLVVLLDGIRTDGGNHDGGGLRIGPDGMLYAGVGDTGIGDFGPPGASTNPYARDVTALEGKILRMTLAGAPAPDNPFAGMGGGADYVFALGLRNPFRFDFDPQSGLLWVGDVGQNTFEEIDIVRAGDDLGWPRCEGREPADRCPAGTTPPVFVYDHRGDDASVTGGTFDASGSYVFADFVVDVVWRLGVTPDRLDVVGPPEVLVRNAGAPVDFQRGPDGVVWYVAYLAGEVVRLGADAGVVSPACTRALARITTRATRRGLACARRGATACDVAIPRRLPRRLARACGAPPSAVCTRLGCADCGTTDALAACAADAAVAAVGAIVARTGTSGRCERATSRAMAGVAAARLAAESPAPSPTLRRPCRTPPPALCRALACTPCTTPGELQACADVAARGIVDDLD